MLLSVELFALFLCLRFLKVHLLDYDFLKDHYQTASNYAELAQLDFWQAVKVAIVLQIAASESVEILVVVLYTY